MSGSSVTIQHNKNMTEANAQTFYDLALDRQKVAVLQITVIVITWFIFSITRCKC